MAWSETDGVAYQLHVSRFNGTVWVPVGASSLNVDPTQDVFAGQVASVGGVPYVTFRQSAAGFFSTVYVERFDGTDWVPVGGPLNVDASKSAYAETIAGVAGTPYVVFQQATAGLTQMRVAREQAPVCSPATVQVPHETGTPVALNCDEGVRKVTQAPAHGVLSDVDLAAGHVLYTPAANYSGPDSIGFTSSDGVLSSAPATVTLDVAAPAVVHTIATLATLRQSHRTFAVGRASTPLAGASEKKRTTKRKAKRPPRGTTFSFALDQPAQVAVAIRRARTGRRVGRACKAPSWALRHKPRCTRFTLVQTLKRTGRSGANRIAFSGRIAGKALAPGRYQAVFTASDTAGTSKPQTLTFVVVR